MLRALSIGALLSLVLVALLGLVGSAQAADTSPEGVHLEAMQSAYSPGVILVLWRTGGLVWLGLG